MSRMERAEAYSLRCVPYRPPEMDHGYEFSRFITRKHIKFAYIKGYEAAKAEQRNAKRSTTDAERKGKK